MDTKLNSVCTQWNWSCCVQFTLIKVYDYRELSWSFLKPIPLRYFALGLGLSRQRRLLIQQWTSDWNHHQTPPLRGHGCRQGAAQHWHLRRVREPAELNGVKGSGLPSSRLMFNDVPDVSVWQVSGAVQAGQSMREVHPGCPQERQQRVLQAQEQPPAGGVGAHDSISASSPVLFLGAQTGGDWTPNHHPLRTSRLKNPPPRAQKWQCSYLACCVVVFFSFSLFLSDLLWQHYSCNHVPLFGKQSPYRDCMPHKFGRMFHWCFVKLG